MQFDRIDSVPENKADGEENVPSRQDLNGAAKWMMVLTIAYALVGNSEGHV